MERSVFESDGPIDADRFDRVVMPHIRAAHNLAQWLTRNEQDGQDVLQEACLRAFRFLGTFRGGNERAWLFAIVRNTYYSWLSKNRSQALNVPLPEDGALGGAGADRGWDWTVGDDVLRGLDREDARRCVAQALSELPVKFRDILILRELEEKSYRAIATISQIPIGAVMSRLSRGRRLLGEAVRRSGGKS